LKLYCLYWSSGHYVLYIELYLSGNELKSNNQEINCFDFFHAVFYQFMSSYSVERRIVPFRQRQKCCKSNFLASLMYNSSTGEKRGERIEDNFFRAKVC